MGISSPSSPPPPHSPIPNKLYGFCGRKAPWKRKNHQHIIITHTCAWSSRITPSYCRFCASASCCRRHSSCRAVAALCSAFSWAAATSSRKLCQGRICAQQGWACVFSLFSTVPVCSYPALVLRWKRNAKNTRGLRVSGAEKSTQLQTPSVCSLTEHGHHTGRQLLRATLLCSPWDFSGVKVCADSTKVLLNDFGWNDSDDNNNNKTKFPKHLCMQNDRRPH